MSYQRGGLIEAVDYNEIINGVNGDGGFTGVNTLWSTGNTGYGYGQTAISTVSSGTTVTASQWATLINAINAMNAHNYRTSYSSNGVPVPVTGNVITYLSTVRDALAQADIYRDDPGLITSTVVGTLITKTFTLANSTDSATFPMYVRIKFESTQKARYFFNCGGFFNLRIVDAVNNDGSLRSADICTVMKTNFAGVNYFRSRTNGGYTGAGPVVLASRTDYGYYNLSPTNGYTRLVKIGTSSSPYSTDAVTLWGRTLMPPGQTGGTGAGNNNANGSNGSAILLYMQLSAGSQTAYAAPPSNAAGTGTRTVNTTTEDSINVTIKYRIDTVYPEATNLTNSWGTVTIDDPNGGVTDDTTVL